MTFETLGEVPQEALLRELFERAATDGDRQKDAFEALRSTAKLAVSQFVDLANERGYSYDGGGTLGYDNEHVGFWVLRSSTGSGGSNDRYGGGYLTNRQTHGRTFTLDYLHIVATDTAQLTVLETSRPKLYKSNRFRLYDPEYALGAIFNISALRASPKLCATTTDMFLSDVQSTIRRLGSGS